METSIESPGQNPPGPDPAAAVESGRLPNPRNGSALHSGADDGIVRAKSTRGHELRNRNF